MFALFAAAASRLLKQIHSDQGLVTVWETETHKMMLMNSTVIGAEYIDSFAREAHSIDSSVREPHFVNIIFGVSACRHFEVTH